MGNLVPWEGTALVLNELSAAGYEVAALSNGDAETLRTAWSVFKHAPASHIFSSDFPVGSFKPLAPIYEQVSVATGLTGEEWLHVAGASFDASGARSAGMLSALSWSESP